MLDSNLPPCEYELSAQALVFFQLLKTMPLIASLIVGMPLERSRGESTGVVFGGLWKKACVLLRRWQEPRRYEFRFVDARTSSVRASTGEEAGFPDESSDIV